MHIVNISAYVLYVLYQERIDMMRRHSGSSERGEVGGERNRHAEVNRAVGLQGKSS